MFFDQDPENSKNPHVQERRLGTFYFTNEFLLTNPPVVFKNLFSKVLPISITFDYAEQTFKVVAFSEHFEPVEIGSKIPDYEVTVKRVGKTKVAYYVTFEQVDSSSLLELLTT
jgi:hypothetical protein